MDLIQMVLQIIPEMNYWLAEHPAVVHFRWSPTESWGSTWFFLIASISAYIAISTTLHVLLLLLRRQKPVPLGPIPALHSLAMALISATIFTGMLSSSVAEIRDTRWFWQRSKTPFQWLLCFPLGTRPSGRVFFWSYIFYLSRFLHIIKTFFTILRRRKFPFLQVFNHSILILMSFLWLEFSQSFQVLTILSMTLVFSLVYGYRFFTEIGFNEISHFPFVMFCQIILLVTNLAWHIGVLVLHFWKGGCNGMGAWVFNTVLNSFVLMFFFHFYVKKSVNERDFSSEVEANAITSDIRNKLVSSN